MTKKIIGDYFFHLDPVDIIKEFNCMMKFRWSRTGIGLLTNYKLSIHVVTFNYNCQLYRKQVIKRNA
jgi:hypothetical protein